MKLQLAIALVLLAGVVVNSAPPRREVSSNFPYECGRLSKTTRANVTFDDIRLKGIVHAAHIFTAGIYRLGHVTL